MPARYDKSTYGKHLDCGKSGHKRHRRRSDIAVIAVAVSSVLIAGVLVFALLSKSDPLVGTWVYDSYTQYVFEKDGSGCLKVDDVRYDYIYKTEGDKLTVNFSEDIVRDCEYTFSISGKELTLIGGENTDGGTYTLKKN